MDDDYENEPVLVRNAIRCNACGEEAESKHRHDYSTCPCGECAADGGLVYLRRAFGEKGYVDISVSEGYCPTCDKNVRSKPGTALCSFCGQDELQAPLASKTPEPDPSSIFE